MQDYTQYRQGIQEAAPQPIYVTSGGGAIIVLANLLLAVVIIWATGRNAGAAAIGIVGAVIAYGTITPISLMALNGGWAAMFGQWQEQRTVRLLRMPPESHSEVLSVVSPYQLGNIPEPLQTLPVASTYVPAVAPVDSSSQREAAAWLIQLYTKEGLPDPKKVLMDTDKERPGRIKIAQPSKPATQWLLDKGILHNLGNGYRLALSRCPTIADAQTMLAVDPRVGTVPTGYHQGGQHE